MATSDTSMSGSHQTASLGWRACAAASMVCHRTGSGSQSEVLVTLKKTEAWR